MAVLLKIIADDYDITIRQLKKILENIMNEDLMPGEKRVKL